MKIISENQIKDLGITPATCVDWAKESFSIKNKAQLPAKISVHPQGNDFFTSMPCLLPQEFSRFGIKVVHRIVGSPIGWRLDNRYAYRSCRHSRYPNIKSDRCHYLQFHRLRKYS